jgi:hypothetical protein
MLQKYATSGAVTPAATIGSQPQSTAPRNIDAMLWLMRRAVSRKKIQRASALTLRT